MQNSRINIDEAGSPYAVVVDFHNAAWQLLDREEPYGFAFQKTAEHLGLEPTIKESEHGQRLYLYGSTESIKTNIPDLHRHIGIIAHTGARKTEYFQQQEREHIGRILGGLTQVEIPALPDDATLMRAAGVMAYPFVDAVSSDLTEVYYARKPYWHGTNEPARHEDGTPMRRFDARDIGGFVIGWNGLAVPERMPAFVHVGAQTMDQLRWLSTTKDMPWAEVARGALRRFLDNPDKPMVEHVPIPKSEDEDAWVRFQLSFPRTDLKELAETYEGSEKVTLTDIIRVAVADTAAEHMEVQ